MTALLAPLLSLAVGLAVLRPLAAGWPRPAFIGAAAVTGPPLLTLALFLLHVAGAPWGWPSLGAVLVLAGGWAFATRRRAGPIPQAPRAWAGPAVLALLALVLGFAAGFARGGPEGDGVLNFGFKARAFDGLEAVWPLLTHGKLAILHADYPLHQPFLMCTGFWCAGEPGGVAALAGDLLVVPGAVLFAGSVAGARHPLAGLLVAFLLAGTPALRSFGTAGYADPTLATLLGVAAGAFCLPGPVPAAAGLAAGLLPWVKQEGALLLVLLWIGALLARRGTPGRRLAYLAPAAVLGAVWPVALLLSGVGIPGSEVPSGLGTLEHAGRVAEGFAGHLVDPDGGLALALLPGVLAALVLLVRRDPAPRLPAALVVLGVVAYPLGAVARQTALEHLGPSGDVPTRLYLHLLPLAVLVLAAALAPDDGRGPSSRTMGT